jgi:hypothetical protein
MPARDIRRQRRDIRCQRYPVSEISGVSAVSREATISSGDTTLN